MPEVSFGAVRSVSSRQNTQREYETVMILRPGVSKGAILELVSKVQGVFEGQGARLLQLENWGVRTLSYPIKRNKSGVYLYWRFLGGSDVVAEFEFGLRINEHVLRYYTVRTDDDVDPHARPSEITEDLLDAVSEPPPDPEPEVEEQEDTEDSYDDDDQDDQDDDDEGGN
ncbi:MAG: 30S ribosomal protein S6 [Nannocystaceae bacterium]|nr:30S ribosomal protein S6 [Myxococcales bacterium]